MLYDQINLSTYSDYRTFGAGHGSVTNHDLAHDRSRSRPLGLRFHPSLTSEANRCNQGSSTSTHPLSQFSIQAPTGPIQRTLRHNNHSTIYPLTTFPRCNHNRRAFWRPAALTKWPGLGLEPSSHYHRYMYPPGNSEA